MAENDGKPRLLNPFRHAVGVALTCVAAFAQANFVAKIPPSKDAKYGIPKYDLLRVVVESLKNQTIDLYQAALLLEINCNRDPVNQVDHPLRLIKLHNNDNIDFSHKTGELLQGLLKSGYTYKEMCDYGLLRISPNSKASYTLRDIYEDNNIHLAESIATHTDGAPRDELQQRNLVAPNLIQKSFSAIPKPVFLKLVTRAVDSDRMNYMQAAMMFSVNCHSLELRRTGHRYLDHPMAVANDPLLTRDQRFLALIHDVIENSNYTIEDLRQAGLQCLVAGVDGLTIRDDEKDDIERISVERLRALSEEPMLVSGYYRFIERCSQNVNSLAVKMADIRNNMLDAKPHKKLEYLVAYAYLDAVQKGDIKSGSSLLAWVQANPTMDLAPLAPETLTLEPGTNTVMSEIYADVMRHKSEKIAKALNTKMQGHVVSDSDYGMMDLSPYPIEARITGDVRRDKTGGDAHEMGWSPN